MNIDVKISLHNGNGSSTIIHSNSYAIIENRYHLTNTFPALIELIHSDNDRLQIIKKGLPIPPAVAEWFINKCEMCGEVIADLTDENMPNVAKAYDLAMSAEQNKSGPKHPAPNGGLHKIPAPHPIIGSGSTHT